MPCSIFFNPFSIDLDNNQLLETVNKKKILFFTPYLERSGSEMVLFNYISKYAKEYDISIITFYQGVLISSLPKSVSVNVITPPSNLLAKLFDFILRKITKQTYRQRLIIRIEKKFKSDVWFINTIALPEVITLAIKENKRCYLYIHELVQMIESMNQEEFSNTIFYPEKILCCSKIAAQTPIIMGRLNNIKIAYPGIDTNKIIQKQTLRFKHIPKDCFVWGMTGRLDFNKNPIFFIELAKILIKEQPLTHFIWFGNQNNTPLYNYCMALVKNNNLENYISWCGNLGDEYINYFKQIDGLVLTSEFESFSLITLEAITLGKPVVTYNCGGVKEILGDNYPIVSSHEVILYCNLMQEVMTNNITKDSMIKEGMKRSGMFELSTQLTKLNEYINE
jgi:L-malate glycosyltransferase